MALTVNDHVLKLSKDAIRVIAKHNLWIRPQVVFVLDTSESMRPSIEGGNLQNLLEWAMSFCVHLDTSRSFKMLAVHQVAERLNRLDLASVTQYVQHEIVDRQVTCGQTKLAEGLRTLLDYTDKRPILAVVFTSGHDEDPAATARILQELSHHPIYVKILHVGSSDPSPLLALHNLKGCRVQGFDVQLTGDLNNHLDLQERLAQHLHRWEEEIVLEGIHA